MRGCFIVFILKRGGTAFVKLGQSLAVRPDVVGESIALHLAQLQDNMPSFSYTYVEKEIQKYLGGSVEELFSYFDKTPIGSASIAQVHFARTKEGEEVAVKILRPNIENRFLGDVSSFEWIAKILEKFISSSRRLRPVMVVQEMKQWAMEELDLLREAKNAKKLRRNFHDSHIFSVPKVYDGLTAKNILTTERVYGIRIDDVEALMRAGIDPKVVLEKSAEIFFLQVFRDGFFHADMHPGNIFVRSDGVLCPVDFGIMGTLTKDTRRYVADVFYYIVMGEYEKAGQIHFNAGYVPSTQSLRAFSHALKQLNENVHNRGDWSNVSMGTLLSDLFAVTKRFQMQTRPELLLLQKTMVVAEGVGRKIAPDENMWLLIRPTMETWMRVNRGIGARAEVLLDEILKSVK